MSSQTELELENLVTEKIKNNFTYYLNQVPIQNRIVDLAAIDKDDCLVGIEFKLKNWKRALEQAYTNRFSFNFLFICMPAKNYNPNLLLEAEKKGIGIIIFDSQNDDVKMILQPVKIETLWYPNLNRLKNYLMSRGNYAVS